MAKRSVTQEFVFDTCQPFPCQLIMFRLLELNVWIFGQGSSFFGRNEKTLFLFNILWHVWSWVYLSANAMFWFAVFFLCLPTVQTSTHGQKAVARGLYFRHLPAFPCSTHVWIGVSVFWLNGKTLLSMQNVRHFEEFDTGGQIFNLPFCHCTVLVCCIFSLRAHPPNIHKLPLKIFGPGLIFETSNLPRCPFSTHMFGFVKALHWKEYVRGSICHTPPKEITAIFRKQTFRADIFFNPNPLFKINLVSFDLFKSCSLNASPLFKLDLVSHDLL